MKSGMRKKNGSRLPRSRIALLAWLFALVPLLVHMGFSSADISKDSILEIAQLQSCSCHLGIPPWQSVNLEKELAAFIPIYLKQPGDGVNDGGGGFFHYFALFVTIRALKPDYVIESGAHNGVGTWFLRQSAGPEAQLFVVSPENPKIYKDPKCEYFTEGNFQDFNRINWASLIKDRERAFVFFDDHQAGIRRMQEAQGFGFRHLMFDDNYLPGTGDNLSGKKLCDPNEWSITGRDGTQKYQDNFGGQNRDLTKPEYLEYVSAFRRVTAVYAEFPPAWKARSRFAEISNEVYDLLVCPPLFEEDFVKSRLPAEHSINFAMQSEKYTQILYLQVSG
jgi:hypothetical protein